MGLRVKVIAVVAPGAGGIQVPVLVVVRVGRARAVEVLVLAAATGRAGVHVVARVVTVRAPAGRVSESVSVRVPGREHASPGLLAAGVEGAVAAVAAGQGLALGADSLGASLPSVAHAPVLTVVVGQAPSLCGRLVRVGPVHAVRIVGVPRACERPGIG